MKFLGERIKRKREDLHLQLTVLAKKVGVSSSALSQIENAKAVPSIVTLKAIADNLHTTVGDLIGENEVLWKNPLTRFDDKVHVKTNESGCALYYLSQHVANKVMDTFLMEFLPDADSSNLIKMHPGQSFIFLVKGELMIDLDGEVYHLKKNDSMYLNANQPHMLKNKTHRITDALLVTTPPVD